MYQITQATRKLAKLTKRVRAVPGGTAAGKTIGILQILIDAAQRDKHPTITSIVSETLPHLKKGAMRDFLDIMQQHSYFDDRRWNKSDFTYTLETGSIIEFFSADQASKVRGPRRNRLFINEANNVPFETYEQLEIRTKEYVFLDWNPVIEFWYYTELQGQSSDVEELVLTYKDNEALEPAIIKSIESRQYRKNWWQVYGLGQLGEVETQIYTGWGFLDDVPLEAKLVRRWLDFGYTNDPSSIGNVYKWNDAFVLDEVTYQKGLANKQIADILGAEDGTALTVGDSAEPKSIAEIKSYNVPIIGSVKGKDSVNNGIQLVQDQKIFITKRSVNTIREYRNYTWMTNRDGKVLNVPEDIWNHSMDGIRYAITSIIQPPKKGVFVYKPTNSGYKRPLITALNNRSNIFRPAHSGYNIRNRV